MTDTTIRTAAGWQASGDHGDIGYETAEGIAEITICRSEVRNAFRPRTLFELSRAFEVARDDRVGVIILTGEGDPACCSGGDPWIRGADRSEEPQEGRNAYAEKRRPDIDQFPKRP